MNGNSSWARVRSQADVNRLLDDARDFHDAVATLACWVGAEEVNGVGELLMDGYGVLTLRISSQFLDVLPLELRFHGVRAFRYDYELDFESSLEFEARGILAKFLAWEIQAEGLEYRSIGSPSDEGLEAL